MQDRNNSASIRRVNRADSYLEALVEKRILSEAGKDWLRLFLDPFHDTSINPQAYPDGRNTTSVTEIINLDFSVRKPVALAAGNWTCHIFSLPILFGTTMSTNGITNIPGGQNIPGWLPVANVDATSFGVNMLNIHAALDGVNLGVFALSPATFVGSLGVPATFKTGVRVTAFAYEVHNTTAKLALQGMSTHYRCPMFSESETLNLCSTVGVTQACSAQVYELTSPPANTANALQMLGTLQWEAKQGNYTVIPINGVENPPQAPANTGFYFFDPSNNRYTAENTLTANPFVTLPTAIGFIDQVYSPFGICGSFYSGLSDTTTLTVKAKIGIERFPSIQVPAEAELIRLCHMTPPRDTLALQIASECIRSLPVAVWVSENSFGDWFIDVADKVLSSALPILSMIPHPIAQGAATIGRALQMPIAKLNMQNRISNLPTQPAIQRAKQNPQKKRKPNSKVIMPLLPQIPKNRPR
jgi:hypothetical protein